MNRRQVLMRVGALVTALAFPAREAAQRVQPVAQRMADAARQLGLRVTDAPSGGPALMNLWRRISEEEEVMVGWVMRDGSVVWSLW